MPLFIFQSLVLVFALVTIFSIVRLKKQGLLGIRGAIFWICFWLCVSGVVFFPQSVQVIARTFGIGRGSDFVLYISIITLFSLVFRLHIKLESIGRDVTKVVRKKSFDEKI